MPITVFMTGNRCLHSVCLVPVDSSAESIESGFTEPYLTRTLTTPNDRDRML